MKPDQHVFLLAGGPKRIIGGVVPISSPYRVGSYVDRLESVFPFRTPDLLRRCLDVLRGDHGGAKKPFRGVGAEISQPIVIGAGNRGGEPIVVIFDPVGGQPASWIKHREIDPFGVHGFYLGIGSPTTTLEIDVLLETPRRVSTTRPEYPAARPCRARHWH